MTIDQDTAEKMTEEYKQLMEQSLQQLNEHKAWLKERMHAWMNAQDAGEWKLNFRVLITMVDLIKLETVRSEPNVKALVKEGEHMVEAPTLSIVYDYPDELMAWLQDENTPAEFRNTIAGAHISDKEEQALMVKRLPDTPNAKPVK